MADKKEDKKKEVLISDLVHREGDTKKLERWEKHKEKIESGDVDEIFKQESQQRHLESRVNPHGVPMLMGDFKDGSLDGTTDVLIIGKDDSYSAFEPDGTLKFGGDATVWDDLRVPAQNTKLNPSKSEPAFESLIGGLFVYKFDATNDDDESVHFIAQMPHSYKEGSDICPHLHWSPDTTNVGNVYWSFEYTIANIDGTIGATTTDDITVATDGVALKHQMDEFLTISGTGLTISHMIICRLTRKSTSEATDTFTGNACFLEFDFHYEKDTIGSRKELTK